MDSNFKTSFVNCAVLIIPAHLLTVNKQIKIKSIKIMKHSHHEEAAKQHEQAAKQHTEAHKANQAGDDAKAADHAHAASGHAANANEHAEHAAKKHSENHSSAKK